MRRRAAPPIFRAIAVAAALLASGRPAGAQQACERLPRAFAPGPTLLTPLRCTPDRPPPPRSFSAFVAKLKEQIARGCEAGQAAGGAYGDSVFARHAPPDTYSADTRRRLMAATMAADPDAAFDITASLRTGDDPSARYAGNIVAGYAILRGRGADSFSRLGGIVAALDADREQSGMPSVADIPFLRANDMLERGDRRGADRELEAAIAIEPIFFNALALAVKLQLSAAIEASSAGHEICVDSHKELMRRMQRIVDLAPCMSLAAHLEAFLARGVKADSVSGSYNVVQIYLALISRRDAFATVLSNRFRNSDVVCKNVVIEEIESWLNQIKTPNTMER